MAMIERRGEFGGFQTRYWEAGDPASPSVLLLHDGAWGGSSDVTWGAVIPLLAERFHVLAPDMLGFGGTDKAVFLDRAPYASRITHLEHLVADLGLDTSHVVGASFGASVALRWAALGGRLASVTAVAGTGGPWRTARSIEGLRTWDGTRDDMARIVGLLCEPGDLDSKIDARMRWATEPGHYRAMMAVAVPLPEALSAPRGADDWPAPLAGVSTPIHLIECTGDDLLEAGWTAHVTAVRPDVRLTVRDYRHSPSIDRPEEIAQILMDGFDAIG